MRRVLALALTASAVGCGADLPPASLIEKLRVLAVRAEPPEVAPGQKSMLDVLAVEPPVQQLDGGPPSPLSYVWLACTIPPGQAEQVPCGVSAANLLPGAGTGGPTTLPPFCADQPGAPLCVIGTDPTGSIAPDRSVLGPVGTGQLLLTVVVADSPEGAVGCLMNTANHDGMPSNPDHCVLALKRLQVSDPARTLSDGAPAPPPNQNPTLDDVALVDDAAMTTQTLLDGNATTQVAPDQNAKAVRLQATRSDGAVEMEPTFDDAGKHTGSALEQLSVSWFTTAGSLDGGRSAFLPMDTTKCPTQKDCPLEAPRAQVDTKWTAPTRADMMQRAPDGGVRFWTVIRDDRGGVGWRAGSAHLQ